MLTALAALILSGHVSKITFESPGITVNALCVELSRQTGKSFVVKDEAQSDLLAIRVTNLPLDDLIKKIEFVDRAKAEFDGATYTLRPDGAVRAKLKAERFALRVKAANDAKVYMGRFLRPSALDDDEAKALARKLSDLQAKEKALDESSVPNASR